MIERKVEQKDGRIWIRRRDVMDPDPDQNDTDLKHCCQETAHTITTDICIVQYNKPLYRK